ncbi:hypothetical protein RMN56_09120 [Micromonospora halotolerans]|uniref:DNRLRE domain-containing protein n=1 Tax=Micromonospora halotolerans TaxID=709879 RepID=A0ABZ0A1N9_9ACTN|nr:hypothetical protein [Micromonospora halotolerans]WNM41484.1 hypothetical protein RMN56_09120 [Micromonospora halotolerans]
MRARRLLAASLGIVLGAGLVSVNASPAQAYEWRDVSKSGWAYTDSQQPSKSFVNPSGDAPIGAWTDAAGTKHKSRSYFTFDVSRFRKAIIHKADLVIAERSAADCATAQPVELWRTDPIKATTSWDSAPRRRELLGTVQAGGEATCPGYLVWDIMPALQKLADQNDQTLTVEIRVPHGYESKLSHGRKLRPFPVIHTETNHAPTVGQIGLEFPSWACGTMEKPQPVGPRYYSLMVKGADADSNDASYYGQFAAWPVGHEDQRAEQFGSSYGSAFSKVDWDMSQYPDGTVVAWTGRAYDDHDFSAWAEPCYVKVDAQRPATPVVTSTKYPSDGQPHGGSGVPGTFTFKANGSSDVVGYYWGRFGETYNYIPAPAPGADVTLEYTPTSFSESLSVRTVDAASNSSETTEYRFYVKSTAPQVRVTVGGVGLPSKLAISTNVEGVTEYGYRIGDGDEVRVPADADGTTDVPVVFTQAGTVKVQVRSYVGSEFVGGYTEDVSVRDTPTVESADFAFPDHDGVVDRPGSFTFRPGRTGVVAYEYAINSDEMRRIDAAADGTAVLRWTPTEPGWTTLRVRSVSGDGTVSEVEQYEFNVIDTKPTVYSSTYYEYGAWGGVGIPGEFNFDTAMPDVDVYLYRLNDGPEQTVDPEYSWARVTLAPDHSGSNTLTVRTRFLDGSFSPTRTYTFEVSDAPVVTSSDYPENDAAGQPGQAGRFTFNPGRSDVTEYRYVLEYSGEEQVVAAGSDGKATVEITPTHSGYTLLTVTSRSADGTVSPERRYYFRVRDPRVNVSSAYDEYSPRGGIGAVGRFGVYTEISEVTTFEYQLNGGAWQSVPKTPDALVTDISVTMDRNGANVFSVRGRTAAGEYTPQTDYPFLVGTAPQVTSDTYPAGQWSGGVGVAGNFTFTQGSPGVVEFEYTVDDGPPVTVAANAAGVATVTYTPTSVNSHTMTVRGRTADGVWTDTTSYYFLVDFS